MQTWIVVFNEPAPKIHLPKGALLVPLVIDEQVELLPELLEVRLQAAVRCAVTEWKRTPAAYHDSAGWPLRDGP